MRGSYLIDSKCMKKVEATLNEKAKLEKMTFELKRDFYSQVSKPTIMSLIDIVNKNGHPVQQKAMKSFSEHYDIDKLEPEDISFMNDMYKQYHCSIRSDDSDKED